VPQSLALIAPPSALPAPLRVTVLRLNKCLMPMVVAASLVLLPTSAPPAEAGQARQARAVSTAHKRHVPLAVGKAHGRQREIRPVRSAGRRTSAARISQRREVMSRPAEMRQTDIEAALQRAERKTGLSASLLRRIAERESRLDPFAQSSSSSARGLMQFTRDTWLEVVRDFGPAHGLSTQAAKLTTDRNGNIGARDWGDLQAILKLRDNPRLSAVLAAERLRKARPSLEKVIGRSASPADLYLVHLLGPSGARNFLTALQKTPERSSTAVVGDAAKPNPGMFVREGKPLPVEVVYEEIAEMLEPENTPSRTPKDQAAPPLLIAGVQ